METGDAKPKVLLIVTGGTVTMVNEGISESLVAMSISNRLKEFPEMTNSALPNYDIYEWSQLYDSSDIGIDEWAKIARQIEKHYNAYDGFVVVHGTDTMAYSSSALSFMLENLHKPVVFTGAMLPITHIRSDARRNLAVAMMVAGYSDITEVCFLFGSRLLRGNRVRKLDCFHMDAFDSPNFPKIGRVGMDITLDENLLLRPSKRGFRIFTDLCRNVLILKVTAGLAPLLGSIFDACEKPMGVILELYGSGTAPCGNKQFLDAIKNGLASGVEIAAVSQCFKGACSLLTYQNGAFLYGLGVIECRDMTPEAAYGKMCYLMGKGYKNKKLKTLMEADIRGEVTAVVHAFPELMKSTTSLLSRGPSDVAPVIGAIEPSNTRQAVCWTNESAGDEHGKFGELQFDPADKVARNLASKLAATSDLGSRSAPSFKKFLRETGLTAHNVVESLTPQSVVESPLTPQSPQIGSA